MKKAHRGRKDLFFLAKDTAVDSQRNVPSESK